MSNNEIDKDILINIITLCINKIFIKLIDNHKQLIINNLFKIIEYFIYKFNFADHYVGQLSMNNYQDIYSLLILLLPFYDLNKSKDITSLDELFKNKNDYAKKLGTSYYIDHEDLGNDYLNNYFNDSVKSIRNTMDKVSYKLLPNWVNIFPYDMNNYQESSFRKYYQALYYKRKFDKNNSSELYSIIYKFLYLDIKDIKWMIFEKKYINYKVSDTNENIVPYIIILNEELNIKNIINEPWDKLNNIKKDKLKENWNIMKMGKNIFDVIKSLILFYLRWEYDKDNLLKLKLESVCLNLIKKKLESNYNINELDEKYILDDNELSNCINLILPQIDFENIYNYIHYCMHKFKYTFYGFMCLNDNHNIDTDNYEYKLNFLLNNLTAFEKSLSKQITGNQIFITPKNIYNFCKSLIHNNSNDKYELISKSYEWRNLDENSKQIIVDRLNMVNIKSWFSIRRNLQRVFGDDIDRKHQIIIYFFEKTDLIIIVILITLVYNGMLTYFKYNPKITDKNNVPDKNKEYLKWEKYILDNINLDKYKDAYHYFANQKYGNIKNSLGIIKETKWYTNFGADWIAQIQVYHHYINQRVLYVTGATGAGKSTVAPFVLLYAVKMLYFKNDANVVCTVPRIQPAEDNTKQISKSIGIPIDKSNIINYIQYETAENKDTSDDYYHPILRLVTDGLLYQKIKSNYLLKKKIKNVIKSVNLYDIVLIDEAHEHNVYMDMILTLCRYGVYINNQVTLGIVSATMDDDEIIYRKFFEIIDDNMKYPLQVFSNDKKFDRKWIDRRIHLSIPFGGMNFDVKEKIEINRKPEDIIIKILKESTDGDILLFLSGRTDIIKMVDKLNNITSSNVLAIPFYSDLSRKLLERVKDINNKETRKLFSYDKNKYTIEDMDNIDKNEPKFKYDRFIIIATNIAEASITINSLKFVVDTGTQKINVYNINKGIAELELRMISKPNQKQRKGRVGRIKPGTVYYTYDITKLEDRVIYKICIENIQDMLYSLYKQNDTNYIINKDNDPNLINDINSLPDFLIDQYSLSNNNKINNQNNKKKYIIKYPYRDGRYDYDTIIDKDGNFYLIHPNEDNFIRDENLKIIKIKDIFQNKIEKIFRNGIKNGFFDNNYNDTEYFKLIETIFKYFSEIITVITMRHIQLIIDLIINYDIDSQVMKNIILFILYSTGTNQIKNNKKISGNADFLIQSSRILPIDVFNYTDYMIILNSINSINDIDCLNKELIKYLKNKLKLKYNKEEYIYDTEIIEIIKKFYMIKIYLKIIISYNELIKKYDYIKENNENEEINKLLTDIIKKNDMKINIKYLPIYDQTCYFIIKYYKTDILIKIPETDYYINYINGDVNEIYTVNKKKTNLSLNIINRFILSLNTMTPLNIDSIMWIPEHLLSLLQIKKTIYNKKINLSYIEKVYDTDFNLIKKKIEKILYYAYN